MTAKPIIYQQLFDKISAERPDQWHWIDTADVARIIRHELAKNFPAVKFSVRLERYAGGSSIDIRWTDGPSRKQVERLVSFLQAKSFDGSIDMACSHDHYLTAETVYYAGTDGTACSMGYIEATSCPQPDNSFKVHMGCHYIFCNHDHSEPVVEAAVKAVNEKYHKDYTVKHYHQGLIYFDHWEKQELYDNLEKDI